MRSILTSLRARGSCRDPRTNFAIGGGVIGASIAYFLSCRGVQSIVIERTRLACAASGKA